MLSLFIRIILATATWEGFAVANGQGTPATLAEAWPALLAASSGLPDMDGTLLLKLLACFAGGLFIWNQTVQAFRRKEPAQIQQPIAIEHVKEFVTVPHLNERLAIVGERCAKLEATVNEVLVNPEGYLHKSVHAVRNGLQAVVDTRAEFEARIMDRLTESDEATRKEIDAKVGDAIRASNSSASKIHQRLDGLAESHASTRGELKGLVEQTGEIRRHLMGGKA